MTGPLASPGYWLHQAALAWKAELDNALKALGLTHTQFILLATTGWLERSTGAPPGQQEVAEGAGADRQMTSRVIRTLEERGLVTRLPHESNTRAFRLTLTSEGRELTHSAITIAHQVDTHFFGADHDDLRDELRTISERRS
ncbi:MarR family transcriptional regulator [Actinocrispum sp. NPDC049592]|uniref:MarR family winged helix-turn-helix transcriptional regulator n=1 Tax=Actinocrispum sp. NPDC049592 TaxID=3154835 RepID=UPI00342F91FC